MKNSDLLTGYFMSAFVLLGLFGVLSSVAHAAPGLIDYDREHFLEQHGTYLRHTYPTYTFADSTQAPENSVLQALALREGRPWVYGCPRDLNLKSLDRMNPHLREDFRGIYPKADFGDEEVKAEYYFYLQERVNAATRESFPTAPLLWVEGIDPHFDLRTAMTRAPSSLKQRFKNAGDLAHFFQREEQVRDLDKAKKASAVFLEPQEDLKAESSPESPLENRLGSLVNALVPAITKQHNGTIAGNEAFNLAPEKIENALLKTTGLLGLSYVRSQSKKLGDVRIDRHNLLNDSTVALDENTGMSSLSPTDPQSYRVVHPKDLRSQLSPSGNIWYTRLYPLHVDDYKIWLAFYGEGHVHMLNAEMGVIALIPETFPEKAPASSSSVLVSKPSQRALSGMSGSLRKAISKRYLAKKPLEQGFEQLVQILDLHSREMSESSSSDLQKLRDAACELESFMSLSMSGASCASRDLSPSAELDSEDFSASGSFSLSMDDLSDNDLLISPQELDELSVFNQALRDMAGSDR